MPSIIIPDRVRERLLSKTDQSGDHWTYPGSGKLTIDGNQYRARTLWWAILKGDGSNYPERMDRTCDEESCCNPDHWFDSSDGNRKPVSPSRQRIVDEVKFHKANGKYYVRNRLTAGKQIQLGSDREIAIELWTEGRPLLASGQYWSPRLALRPESLQLTVSQLCSLYEQDLMKREADAQIVPEYRKAMIGVCRRMVKQFGVRTLVSSLEEKHFEDAAEKIQISRTSGKLRAWHGYKTECNNWRDVFRWGLKKGRLIKLPNFGGRFPESEKAYNRRANRLQRINGIEITESRVKLFSPSEINAMLEVAPLDVAAWIYLGLNLAVENKEIGVIKATDFCQDDAGDWWYEAKRLKTAEPRKNHVWPETIQAIQDWLGIRPQPRREEYSKLLFLNRNGDPIRGKMSNSTICDAMKDTMEKAGCYIRGRSFYGLRHTFSTIAGGACDLQAKEYIMGHATPAKEFAPQSKNYDHAMAENRLRHVSNYVRDWLRGVGEESVKRKIVRTLEL
jgi:integrase